MNKSGNERELISISRTLRRVEWIAIAVHIAICASDRELNILPDMAFYSFFIGLSWIFPIDKSRWQRQGYLLIAIVAIAIANLLGVSLDLLIYLYIAKSCFLLDRKSLWLTTIITGIIWIASECISESKQALSFMPPFGFGIYDLRKIAISSLGIYLVGAIFFILLCLTVLAEQKSRHQAEVLAKQVESLAATLERTRIARDLHDSLGHTLTNLQIQLAVAQKLRQRDPNKAFQAIDIAKLLADRCIEDVSQALQTIRQSDFDTVDLDRVLRNLIEQFNQDRSLKISWKIDLPKLSRQTNYQIYCIVKEGLINIQKHARASRVDLQGCSTPEGVVLELIDDGIGFDPQTTNSGFGLQGMTERVRTLGGDLAIKSTPGRGTHIQITIPILCSVN